MTPRIHMCENARIPVILANFRGGSRELYVPMKSFALILTLALAAVAQDPDLANQVKTVHLTRVSKPPKLEDFINGNIPPGQAR